MAFNDDVLRQLAGQPQQIKSINFDTTGGGRGALPGGTPPGAAPTNGTPQPQVQPQAQPQGPAGGLQGMLADPGFIKMLAQLGQAFTARDPNAVGSQIGAVAEQGATNILFGQEQERSMAELNRLFANALGGGGQSNLR